MSDGPIIPKPGNVGKLGLSVARFLRPFTRVVMPNAGEAKVVFDLAGKRLTLFTTEYDVEKHQWTIRLRSA